MFLVSLLTINENKLGHFISEQQYAKMVRKACDCADVNFANQSQHEVTYIAYNYFIFNFIQL